METRTIMLKTTDILASTDANDYFNTIVSNSKGIVENNQNSYTWHINLRETLGNDFYNKYTRFSVRLRLYGDQVLSTTVIDPSNTSMQFWTRINSFYLSGLNYDPMPYMNGTLSNSALIHGNGVRPYPATAGLTIGSTNISDNVSGQVNYFTKPTQDTVSLRIDIRLNFNDQPYQPPTSAQIYGHSIFGLSVAGIV